MEHPTRRSGSPPIERGVTRAAAVAMALLLVSSSSIAQADDLLVGVWRGTDQSAGTLQGVEPPSWEHLVFNDRGELSTYAGPVFMGSYRYLADAKEIFLAEIDVKLGYSVSEEALRLVQRNQGDLLYERLRGEELDDFLRNVNVKP